MSGGNSPSGSAFAANDAQFGITQVLKPFPNFEDVYQGRARTNPIAFPGGLDAQAGKPGYATNLLAGVSVPLGARVLLWIPTAFAGVAVPPTATVEDMDYFLIWRLRNVRDFRDPGPDSKRNPFHFPRQSPGAPNTLPPPAKPRFVLPALSQQVVVENVTLAGPNDPVTSFTKKEIVRVGNGSSGAFEALTPSGILGIVQQGVLDPLTALPAFAGNAIFSSYSTFAQGDELIIFATPSKAQPGENWDFTTETADLPFSNVYGKGGVGAGAHPSYPDVGIYLMVGTPGPDSVPRFAQCCP